MTDTEKKIVMIAHTRYNVFPGEPISPELRRSICRRFHIEETPPIKTNKESNADRRYREAREHRAAVHDIKQREEINNPTPERSAKAIRIELIEGKIRRTTAADPNYRHRLEQELEQAKRELEQEQRELEQAKQAEAQAVELAANDSYMNAIESAEATERLTRDDPSEHVQSLVRLKMLQGVKPGEVEQVVSDYWQGYATYEDRQGMVERDKLVESTRKAAEAVAEVTDQEQKVLEAQKRADLARIDSE